MGDIDHGRVAIVTKGPRTVVRFAAQAAVGAALTPLPFTTLDYRGHRSRPRDGRTQHIESIDYAGGVLATIMLEGTTDDGGGSTVLSCQVATDHWYGYLSTGYGLMDGVEAAFRAVQVTPTGIRAFSDAAVESDPFVGSIFPSLDRVGNRQPQARGAEGRESQVHHALSGS